jgi:L-gulonolactone oxidase
MPGIDIDQPTPSPSAAQLKALSNDHLGELVKPFTLAASSPRARFMNWGQTYLCKPLAVFEPRNEYECQLLLELARREGKSLRPVGVGHSPSDLACTSEYMARMERLDRVLEASALNFPSSIFYFFLLLSCHQVHSLPYSLI